MPIIYAGDALSPHAGSKLRKSAGAKSTIKLGEIRTKTLDLLS